MVIVNRCEVLLHRCETLSTTTRVAMKLWTTQNFSNSITGAVET